MKLFCWFLKTLPFWSILFVLMGGSALRIGGYPLLPTVFLIPIYYWLVFRPDWLPLESLFGMGLVYDGLMGNELGISSLLLMVSAFLGQYIRPLLSPHQFLLLWGSFGLYSGGYLFLYGLFVSQSIPLLVSWIYGILLYPLMVWILSHLHVRLHAYA